ncbi:MAG TPA: glutathione S-transferase family protein [Myxococcota bacterium]|jgi:glutathione S-transferase
MALKLIGAGLSPFVRKVRVALTEKGLAFEHEQLTPFGPNPEYRKLHPLGKIPTLTDGDRVIPDSSAIVVYLERQHPNPPLISADAYQAARTVWYEEYADSALVQAVVPYFQQRVLFPLFMKKPGDESQVAKAASEAIPPVFEYLEGQIGDSEYLVGNRFSLADISTASPFVNYQHGGGTIDRAKYPRLASFVERIHARPSFKGFIAEEQAFIAKLKG